MFYQLDIHGVCRANIRIICDIVDETDKKIRTHAIARVRKYVCLCTFLFSS